MGCLVCESSLNNNPESDENLRSSVSLRTTFGVFIGYYTGFFPVLVPGEDRTAPMIGYVRSQPSHLSATQSVVGDEAGRQLSHVDFDDR